MPATPFSGNPEKISAFALAYTCDITNTFKMCSCGIGNDGDIRLGEFG